MRTDLTVAFDALAPLCDVAAPLCESAGSGGLDVPHDLRGICTQIGLPQTRAGDVERTLAAGQMVGVFLKASELTWQTTNKALAAQLAALLRGADLYRRRVVSGQ